MAVVVVARGGKRRGTRFVRVIGRGGGSRMVVEG
jgi:hypothetical protein